VGTPETKMPVTYKCTNASSTLQVGLSHQQSATVANPTVTEYGPGGLGPLTCNGSSVTVNLAFSSSSFGCDTWTEDEQCIVEGIFQFTGESSPVLSKVTVAAHIT
jgi:hypothetical protein